MISNPAPTHATTNRASSPSPHRHPNPRPHLQPLSRMRAHSPRYCSPPRPQYSDATLAAPVRCQWRPTSHKYFMLGGVVFCPGVTASADAAIATASGYGSNVGADRPPAWSRIDDQRLGVHLTFEIAPASSRLPPVGLSMCMGRVMSMGGLDNAYEHEVEVSWGSNPRPR